MKLIEKSILLGCVLTVLLTMTGFAGRCEMIENKVFRLHVLANSDSEEDQALKLKVRDRILSYSDELFDQAQTKEDAEMLSQNSLEEIKLVAEEEIHKQGYDYPVRVELTNMYFNTRHYQEITMPAGHYDALRVLIGSGEGKNWWCVMFPPMCLPAAEESKELEDVLSASELKLVQGGTKYEIKFKCVELFETMKNQLCFQ